MVPTLLCLWLGSAEASEAAIWLGPEVDEARARAAVELLGETVVEVRPLAGLADDLRVVGLLDRSVEELCGGPIAVEDWRQRLERGRASLQGLVLSEALSGFGVLEAELPCLTELILPGDAFRFHLASVELHRVAAALNAADPTLVAFHEREARLSAGRAAAIGPKVHLPADTLPEAVALLNEVRTAQSVQLPVRLVVFGPAERVWWNGTPAQADPFEVPAGTQILQLTDGGTAVVAVGVVDLLPGEAVLVWADRDIDAPTAAEIGEAAHALGEHGRTSMVLGPVVQALNHRRAAYLVTEHDGRLRVWAEQGGKIMIKLAEPEAPPDTGKRRRRSG